MAGQLFDPRSLSIRDTTPPVDYPNLRSRAFSFSSRGDRVPGRLLLPETGDGPFPLVLLAHGAGGAKDASYMDAAAGPWARRGLAVASIDFPLHGERAESKLYQMLAAELSGVGPGAGLASDFVQQALGDLSHALDAVCSCGEVDSTRLAYAGFSLGSMLGAMFCARDARIRAAALALGGTAPSGSPIDPTAHIAKIAPRPLLLVNANSDETIPRESALALFDAAVDPKEQLWFDGTHTELPGQALKTMFEFLERHLAA